MAFQPVDASQANYLGGYAEDELPPERRQQEMRMGVAFQTDLGAVGQAGQKGAFGVGSTGVGGSVEQEERRLIDKVFNLVDRDGSGHIDITELSGMFSIFGIESSFISSAISRVMGTIDKDRDNMITPKEFYDLLSQRFEKGDTRKDIDAVFHKMDKDRDGLLAIDELWEVSKMLGENAPRSEIEDMIKVFSLNYQVEIKDFNAKRGKERQEPKPPTGLDANDFYEAMQMEFKTFGTGIQGMMQQQQQQ